MKRFKLRPARVIFVKMKMTYKKSWLFQISNRCLHNSTQTKFMSKTETYWMILPGSVLGPAWLEKLWLHNEQVCVAGVLWMCPECVCVCEFVGADLVANPCMGGRWGQHHSPKMEHLHKSSKELDIQGRQYLSRFTYGNTRHPTQPMTQFSLTWYIFQVSPLYLHLDTSAFLMDLSLPTCSDTSHFLASLLTSCLYHSPIKKNHGHMVGF